MTTLTELVASVVVHSSVVAFSHFGVVLDAPQLDRPTPAAERVVARTPVRKIEKLTDCPQARRSREPLDRA